MASNRPPEGEIERLLREQAGQGQLQRDLQQLIGPQGVPILGQPPVSTKRWQCPKCGAIVGAMPQMVQLPGGLPFHAPDGQVLTLLPGEGMPTFLCSRCDVYVRRQLVPALEEIDEDDNVIMPGLRAVPSEPEEQE